MRFIRAALRLWRRPTSPSLSFSSSSSSAAAAAAALGFRTDEMAGELEGYTVFKEGEVQILMHSTNSVFYNKAQVNNRDMSIAVMRTYISKCKEEHSALSSKRATSKTVVPEDMRLRPVADEPSNTEDGVPSRDGVIKPNQGLDGAEDILREPMDTIARKGHKAPKDPRVLEALAASGLRALRYAREVDGIGQVIALDNDKASVEACKKNILFNGSVVSSKVEIHLADARVYMLNHPREFDVVDLDPYGSPSIFLDSAVQSVADGGILMCTATDMAVLCGRDEDACYSRYGSYPLKGKYCHEMAIRILLACIESHANRYKRYIVPILSVHMDFYIRVFVRIFTSASAMKNTPLKLSYVYQCVGCDSFHLQALGMTITKNNTVRYAPGFGPVVSTECSECGKKFNMGGPIWSDSIHDQEWVSSILADVKAMKERYPAYKKICGVLTTISEELPDVPLFVDLHNLSATLKCISPSASMFRTAVINAGYRISGSHTSPLALKSDAPMSVIWDIMRCWVKKHPVRAHPSDHSGTVILTKEPTLQANFARSAAYLRNAQDKKVARFPLNPERNWGPKIRAGRKITGKHITLLTPPNVSGFVNHEGGKVPAFIAPEYKGLVSHEEDGADTKHQNTADGSTDLL